MNDQQRAEITAAFERLAAELHALSDLVLAGNSPPPVTPRLNVPWLSQLGSTAAYARGDCGTACVAMLVNFKGTACTVDDMSKATGRAPGFTLLSFNELTNAALKFGTRLVYASVLKPDLIKADLDAGHPSIALVNYKSLPAVARFDSSYNAGHYLLLVGYTGQGVIYHDPYWPLAEGGAFRELTWAEFEKAHGTPAPGNQYAHHLLRSE